MQGGSSSDLKLYMFYVGGSIANANTELHDVRFSVGATVEDCHADLRRQWWGTPRSLHIDCWGAIEQADGYDVLVTRADAGEDPNRLYFANMGGYDPAQFTELHRNLLLVATDPTTAKQRAKSLIQGWRAPHKDTLNPVDTLLDLSRAVTDYRLGLTLRRAAVTKPFTFNCDYLPIGKP